MVASLGDTPDHSKQAKSGDGHGAADVVLLIIAIAEL